VGGDVCPVLGFCHEHLPELQKKQAGIEQSGGLHYPHTKLVDMYCWQIGYERGTVNVDASANNTEPGDAPERAIRARTSG